MHSPVSLTLKALPRVRDMNVVGLNPKSINPVIYQITPI